MSGSQTVTVRVTELPAALVADSDSDKKVIHTQLDAYSIHMQLVRPAQLNMLKKLRSNMELKFNEHPIPNTRLQVCNQYHISVLQNYIHIFLCLVKLKCEQHRKGLPVLWTSSLTLMHIIT